MPISIASAPASAIARTTSSQPEPSPPVTYGHEELAARASRRGPQMRTRGFTRALAGEPLGDLRGVLVAPARQRDEHRRAARHRSPGLAGEPADRVRRLERGHDALGDRQQLEPGERLVVGGELVRGPARGRELRVLGPDARVVEAGADRVRLEDLAVFVLQEERAGAVQHARARPGSPTRRAGPTRARGPRPRRRRGRRRCRRSRRRCPSRSSRRRRTRRRGRGRRRRGSRGTARALRRRRRAGTRAPSTGTGAGRRPSRCSSACSRPSRPSRAAPR